MYHTTNDSVRIQVSVFQFRSSRVPISSIIGYKWIIWCVWFYAECSTKCCCWRSWGFREPWESEGGTAGRFVPRLSLPLFLFLFISLSLSLSSRYHLSTIAASFLPITEQSFHPSLHRWNTHWWEALSSLKTNIQVNKMMTIMVTSNAL